MSSSNKPPLDQMAIVCIPELRFKEIVDYHQVTPVHYYDYGKVCLNHELFDRYQCATTCQAENDSHHHNFLLLVALLTAIVLMMAIKDWWTQGDNHV
jgi:hypothetical protein